MERAKTANDEQQFFVFQLYFPGFFYFHFHKMIAFFVDERLSASSVLFFPCSFFSFVFTTIRIVLSVHFWQ